MRGAHQLSFSFSARAVPVVARSIIISASLERPAVAQRVMMPERCRTIARHMFRESPLSILASSEVVLNWGTVARQLSNSSSESRASVPSRIELADYGNRRAALGRNLANLDPNWPKLVQTLADFGQSLANADQASPTLVTCWPSWPNSNKFGQPWPFLFAVF